MDKIIYYKILDDYFDRDEINRYPIPQNLNNNKEMIRAIILLNSDDNSKLLSKISMEKKLEKICSKNIENKTQIKNWINSILKNNLLDRLIIPFPEVAAEYFIKICKKNIKFKNICILLLEKFIREGLIENKEIYKYLINKYYNKTINI